MTFISRGQSHCIYLTIFFSFHLIIATPDYHFCTSYIISSPDKAWQLNTQWPTNDDLRLAPHNHSLSTVCDYIFPTDFLFSHLFIPSPLQYSHRLPPPSPKDQPSTSLFHLSAGARLVSCFLLPIPNPTERQPPISHLINIISNGQPKR